VTVSQPDSSSVEPRGIVVQKKPKFDVYTWMLILAFLALCVGSAILYLEKRKYEMPPQEAQAAPVQVVELGPNAALLG
jgi:hypothetical protein